MGPKSPTNTVDVAPAEERQRLVELLFEPGALELSDPDAMSGAWR